MVEAVRLIVWDLDETFWAGTLTEGGITAYVDDHHDLVIDLTKRGIISSICSKNNIEDVKIILEEKGLWSYFIFPSIDWSGKGNRLKDLIEEVQLRPETVLFIDDNPSNRAEAIAIVPGIQVADETIIPSIRNDPRFKGKSDPEMTRLAQYKLLEARYAEKKKRGTDTAGFLRASSIKVEIDYNIDAHYDRIVELINRTNQLNFTKLRLSNDAERAKAELQEQLKVDYTIRAGIVKVRDRFGDHGIVGFWMMKNVSYGRGRLVHFCFSCRTLGMGIEQWVYDKLGQPSIEIIGEVVAQLNFSPDWINQIDNSVKNQKKTDLSATQVVLRGGCELEVLRHYFSFDALSVKSEFVEYRRTLTTWLSHIVTFFEPSPLREAMAIDQKRVDAELHALTYYPSDFGSALYDKGEGERLVVISNSADGFASIYRHRELGFMVPAFRFGLKPLHNETQDGIDRFIKNHKFEAMASETEDAISGLQTRYDLVPLNLNLARTLYLCLLDAIPPNTFVVFLLPLDYEPTASNAPLTHQTKLNNVLIEIAKGRHNVGLIKTSDLVTSNSQIMDGSRFHFTRDVFHSMYEKICSLYGERQRV